MITGPITNLPVFVVWITLFPVVCVFPELQFVSARGSCLKLPSYVLFILKESSCILAWCNDDGTWIFNIYRVLHSVQPG